MHQINSRKRLLPIITCLLFFAHVAVVNGQIIPAIERETGQVREITITNAAQTDVPVDASAVIKLGERSYGAGFLTLKTKSALPITGIKGCWEVTTSEGGKIRDSWTYGGATSIFKGGIKAGTEIKVPVGGSPASSVSSPHRITKISLLITGVSYLDKTWSGETGYAIHRYVEDDAEYLLLMANKLKEVLNGYPPDVTAQILKNDRPNSPTRLPLVLTSMRTRMIFSAYLLNERGELNQDAKAWMNRFTDSLGSR